MFTGIVEKTLRVVSMTSTPKFHRLTLAADWSDLRAGESIAVNGCCVTVAQVLSGQVTFDVIAETLQKTNLGFLKAGDAVNAERSLRVGDRLDGHFVQGHIDGLATLIDAKSDAKEWRLTLESPFELSPYLIPKGSVALDGVSLTIASVKENVFEVALIPTTIKLTTIGTRVPGWSFNLETDVLSKTVVSWLQRQGGRSNH
ncbi:MAG: riboflavin synthase [Planctomycetota bacterium]|nr:riboflavin synthase [Planctomycetota bacterium]